MDSIALIDIGKQRSTNQDYVFNSDIPVGNLPNLYIVADGMGGHKAGDLASKYAVDVFVEHVRTSTTEKPIPIIQESLSKANLALMEKAAESIDYEGMGTTFVAATIVDNTLYVANVGDSRLYILNDELIQITRDHSLVEEMITLGELDKDSARLHANKNIITKAVGADKDLQADYFEQTITDTDIILLCSDGLTNMIEDNAIKDILHKGKELTTIAEKLINTANRNGGKDNISVVLVVKNLK